MPNSAPLKTGHFGYEASGEPGSPPLVFLHGIGGAARAWRGQIEAFSGQYRAIAWDMPGSVSYTHLTLPTSDLV